MGIRLFSQINSRVYLILAILIFSTSGSVVRKLTEIGARHLIDGRNPISFCNVLFVGNLVALILMIFFYRQELVTANLSKISFQDIRNMTLVAILDGALVPSLFFTALANTMVNNVILIGRIEPPLSLALAILLFKEKVNPWVIIGAVFSFLGVILTIILQSPTSNMIAITMGEIKMGVVNQGDLLALGAAICLSIAITISKVSLAQIPLGIFTCYKTLVGTIVFFITTLIVYNFEHFADIFSPILWQWMLFYGAVIVAGGQIFWLSGLKKSTASEVSFASSFSPILGIIGAFVIIGEIPTMAQYIGGAVIIIGIFMGQMGLSRKTKKLPIPKQCNVAKEMQDISFPGI